MFCDDIFALAIDIGHTKSVIGYVGDEAPKYFTHSVVGHLQEPEQGNGGMQIEEDSTNRYCFGEDFPVHLTNIEVDNILEQGTYKNVDVLSDFLDYLIKKIRVDPSQTPIMVTDQNQQTDDKEKLIELTFEKFNSPAFFTSKRAVLSLFANGRTTGFVLQSGGEMTQAMPINDGYILNKGLNSFNTAGEYVTTQVLNFLKRKSVNGMHPYFDYKYSLNHEGVKEARYEKLEGVRDSVRSFYEMRLAREAKEALVKVRVDGNSGEDESCYELPDGSKIDFGQECYNFSDIFFSENSDGYDGIIGCHKLVLQSINRCDIDLREQILSNILVTGGNTLIKGFNEKFEKLLYSSAPQSAKVKIYSYPNQFERIFSSWLGASILSSTGSFQNMWISKFEYEESGVSIVKRKCC